MRILVFGDSVAEGYYDMEMGGWVNRLRMHLWKNDKSKELANCGIAGDSTNDLLKRYKDFKRGYNEKYQEDTMVIFAIGVNDSYVKDDGENQISLDTFEENLRELQSLSDKDPLVSKVVFLSLLNVDESKTCPVSWKEIYYKNEEIEKYNQVIKTVAEENKSNFVNLYGMMENDDLCDGIHPNARGHEKIYEEVKKQLNY